MKTSRILTIVALGAILASMGTNGGGRQASRAGNHLAAAPLAPSAPAAIRFRREGACQVPILSRAIAFKGGATNGEEVSVKLDTARHNYEIRIDASTTPGRQGMRRSGTLLLDRHDCSYQLSGEAAARLAVNKDGVLFGGLLTDGDEAEPPALIVAFKNTSSDILDLSGNWWVFESRSSAEAAASSLRSKAYEARILPDGRFSRCEPSGGPCSSRIGRIYYNGTVFVSQAENGNTETLVVGQVGRKLVPILLQQGGDGAGMRLFAPHRPPPASAPSPARPPAPALR